MPEGASPTESGEMGLITLDYACGIRRDGIALAEKLLLIVSDYAAFQVFVL